MINSPKFEYYDGSNTLRPADELSDLKKGKVRNSIELLNRSGVLMVGNGALSTGMNSYSVSIDTSPKKDIIQIMTAFPHRIVSCLTYETLELREQVNESMRILTDWVGAENISKRLLGQTILMKMIYPDFDKETFIQVVKNGISLPKFSDIIDIGGGVFEEELIIVGTLPDFLTEALKHIE